MEGVVNAKAMGLMWWAVAGGVFQGPAARAPGRRQQATEQHRQGVMVATSAGEAPGQEAWVGHHAAGPVRAVTEQVARRVDGGESSVCVLQARRW